MIQKHKLTLILLTLNIITFIILFALSNGQYKSHQKSQGLNFAITGFIHDLEGIKIEGKQLEESLKIAKKGNQWFIIEPVEWPANNFSVNQILHQLNLLKESAKFTYNELIKTDQQLEDFGLDQPKLTLTLTKGTQALKLLVGNSTPLGNKLYIYLPKKESIYVVESELLKDDVFRIGNLYRNQIFDIPNFEIDGLNYQFQSSEQNDQEQMSVRLEKNINDQSWKFKSPLNAEANALLVEKTLQALTSSEVEKFLSNEIVDPNMLGFENPYMKISIEGNKRRNTLILGNNLNDPNNNKRYYAKLEGFPTVFTVRGNQYEQFIQAHKDLREKNFIKLDPKSISTIDVTNLKNYTKLQKLENDEWQAIVLNEDSQTKPFQADSAVIYDLINDLNNLRAESFYSDNSTKEDLALLNFDKPILQILIYNNEETIVSINIVEHPLNETLLLVKINNDSTIYSIERTAYISNFSAEPIFYKNRIIEKFPPVAKIQELIITDIMNNKTLLYYPSKLLDSKTISILFESLKEFKVASYINPDIATQAKWKYKLNFKVSLPGDSEDKLEERIYYISKRMPSEGFLGRIPSQNLVFKISENLISALNPFINLLHTDPRKSNIEASEATVIERIPALKMPKK